MRVFVTGAVGFVGSEELRHVTKLGASQIFDYRSRTVVEDVIKASNGRTIAGALAIGLGSAKACLDIVHACKGGKFVSMATPPASFDNSPLRSSTSAQRF